jgi:hypothetical protein
LEEADGGLVVKSTRIGGSERMRNRGAVGTHVVGQDLRQTRRYRLSTTMGLASIVTRW